MAQSTKRRVHNHFLCRAC